MLSISHQTYNSKRRIIQFFSTILIVILPFFNVLRLDIPTLRFYFFNSVLWVDEFYLLFLVLMLILFVIVIFSTIYGRVWCGWMCPQTALSELVYWFEGKTKRWMKVPKTGGSMERRIGAVTILSLGTLIVSFIISFNLISYFVDPYGMIRDIYHGALGPVTTGIFIGIAVLMFVDVMFWREKFCSKACPYGMMQIVITDSRTQIVRYQTERRDECIECKACVRDCMMGIDIRKSPYQTECIHCGVCVDSCATILARLKKPTLITFSWGEQHTGNRWFEKLGIVDAKRWIIAAALIIYAAALAFVIHSRQPLSLTASGDRSTLFRQDTSGIIYNDYVVKISNRSMNDGIFKIHCATVQTSSNECTLQIKENPVGLKSREVKTLSMIIGTTGTTLHPGPNKLSLEAVNIADTMVKTETEIVFFMPEAQEKKLF